MQHPFRRHVYLRQEVARRDRLRRLEWLYMGTVVAVVVLGFVLGMVKPAASAEWNIKELLSQYSCDWVRQQRKTHTDAELEQKAKDLRLPDVVVRAARRCKR